VIATQHTSVQALHVKEGLAEIEVNPAGIAFYAFQDQNNL
jgi:hypothetical protein